MCTPVLALPRCSLRADPPASCGFVDGTGLGLHMVPPSCAPRCALTGASRSAHARPGAVGASPQRAGGCNVPAFVSARERNSSPCQTLHVPPLPEGFTDYNLSSIFQALQKAAALQCHCPFCDAWVGPAAQPPWAMVRFLPKCAAVCLSTPVWLGASLFSPALCLHP